MYPPQLVADKDVRGSWRLVVHQKSSINTHPRYIKGNGNLPFRSRITSTCDGNGGEREGGVRKNSQTY